MSTEPGTTATADPQDRTPIKAGGPGSNIQGLILAAGKGSRLGDAADTLPKCLLEVGPHCLAEHQLSALAEAGVGPTTMVVGYAAHDVREAVGIRAEYVTNTRWGTTNSLYSFWLARQNRSGPVLVMNCDVLFPPRLLERLLATGEDAIAIDSSSGCGREQMKVEVIDGCLADMSKDLPLERTSGENVGVMLLSEETVADLTEEARQMIEDGQANCWLGAALRRVAARRPIQVVDVADLPWIEIDFPIDLVRARKVVWPRILGQSTWQRLRGPLSWVAGVIALCAVLLAMGWFAPIAPERVWESIHLDSERHEPVLIGEQRENWWAVEPDSTVQAVVAGPGPLRVDTRLLDPEPGRSDYVIEVNADGKRVGWYVWAPELSSSRKHPKWGISRRDRVELDLEGGLHEIEVRLVAPADAMCLIRIRRLETPGND